MRTIRPALAPRTSAPPPRHRGTMRKSCLRVRPVSAFCGEICPVHSVRHVRPPLTPIHNIGSPVAKAGGVNDFWHYPVYNPQCTNIQTGPLDGGRSGLRRAMPPANPCLAKLKRGEPNDEITIRHYDRSRRAAAYRRNRCSGSGPQSSHRQTDGHRHLCLADSRTDQDSRGELSLRARPRGRRCGHPRRERRHTPAGRRLGDHDLGSPRGLPGQGFHRGSCSYRDDVSGQAARRPDRHVYRALSGQRPAGGQDCARTRQPGEQHHRLRCPDRRRRRTAHRQGAGRGIGRRGRRRRYRFIGPQDGVAGAGLPGYCRRPGR